MISSRMDWLDLLAVQGTLKSLLQKHQFFWAQLSSQSNAHIHTWPQEQAEKLVAEEAIYVEAKRQCQEMVEQTKARLAELRRASNDYMDDALRRTEESIAMSLEDVRETRAKFKALVEAQEKRTESTAPAETEG